MKKLFIIAIVTVSSINCMFSQVKNNIVPKFKLTDTIGTWNRGNLYRDSIKREFIQVEIIKQINAERVAKGVAPLIPDVGLKPAAVHNAIYNRYCLANEIEQTPGQTIYMSHFQNVDIPNFNEITDPGARIKLLDQTKFSSITEELTFNVICACKPETFLTSATNTVNNFKASVHHWDAITSADWDVVYVYYDLHATSLVSWTNPFTGIFESMESMNVITYIILGKRK